MRRIGYGLCLLALGGCSDMSDLLSFDNKPAQEPVAAAAPAAPAPAAAPDDSFCRAVAQQDATRSSFDPETQKRMLVQSYTQCRTIYAR